MENLALDIDKYITQSVNFRETYNLEPIEGICLLKENNLIEDMEHDSSFEDLNNNNNKKQNNLNNNISPGDTFNMRKFSFENKNHNNNYPNEREKDINNNHLSEKEKDNKEKIRSEKSKSISHNQGNLKTEKNEKINKRTSHNFHTIAEEGKSDFLLTGMRLTESNKKTFYDLDNENLNELKQSKYLPPLTKRSSYFKNKNIKFGSDNNNDLKFMENDKDKASKEFNNQFSYKFYFK